jgi:3-oxoacyl-[acyl-carrier-protein] synthase II
MKRVVVSGIGLVSPLGNSFESVCNAVTAPKSALTCEDYKEKNGVTRKLPLARAAYSLIHSKRLGVIPEDRCVSLACAATDEALKNASLSDNRNAEFRKSMFIAVGSGVGPIHAVETAFANWHATNLSTHPLTIVRGLHNGIAAEIAIRHGIQGAAHTFAMACASSGVAIASAVRSIRSGACNAAVVCGADAPLTQPMIDAWLAMRVYATCTIENDDETGCIPFGRNRNGLALAESAATLVLEDIESAWKRGHEPIAEILGCGESTDATHMTNPSAQAQTLAMRLSLQDASLKPEEISYINAHATGTVAGDVAEANSIATVFPNKPLVSSTKSIHGHALGGAGTLETIVSIAASRLRCAPPTLGLNNIDEKCEFIQHVTGSPRELPERSICLTNSFAFGGHNVSLVLRAA